LTGATIDPVGFAKIKIQVDGSVAGGGGTAGVFGGSRFNLSLFAVSSDNAYSSRFILQTLISGDPDTGAMLLSHSLETADVIGRLPSYSLTGPADPFGTYDWIIPFDINQSWSLTANLSCLTTRSANGNSSANDTASLNCSLGNSVTLMGVSFLDPGGTPLCDVTCPACLARITACPTPPCRPCPNPPAGPC